MLEPAERLFFDLNGYVLLKGVLDERECAWLLNVAHSMLRAAHDDHSDQHASERILFGPVWADRRILTLAMEARLRGRAENLVGGESRLEENQFLVSLGQVADPGSAPRYRGYRWHRGLAPSWGAYEADDRYYCLFVKALLYLTPIAPSERTWVIPGSHKLRCDVGRFAALCNESMMRPIDSSAGDLLLFGETLIHSSPPESSSRERLLLALGYSAPFLRPWSAQSEPPTSCDVMNGLARAERSFIHGEGRYDFRGGG